MGRSTHVSVCRPSAARERMKQPLPDPAFSPSEKTIIDGRRRIILGRKITPPAPCPQHVQDAANHLPVINPFLAAHVSRQGRLYPDPLLIR